MHPSDDLNALELARAIPDLRLRYVTLRRLYAAARWTLEDARAEYVAAKKLGRDDARLRAEAVANTYIVKVKETEAAIVEAEGLLGDDLDEELKSEAGDRALEDVWDFRRPGERGWQEFDIEQWRAE